MPNRGQILLFILLLLLTLSGGYWFYNNFGWVAETQEVGFQGEAKTNRLLAAEFFLRKMGIPVQQVNALTAFRDLPSVNHTILISTRRETLNKQLHEKLLAWVRSGGHLIVRARYKSKEEDFQDDLLQAWQIFLSKNTQNSERESVTFTVDSTELKVAFPRNLILKTAAKEVSVSWQIQDQGNYYLLQFPMGQGRISVLSSMAMFNNQSIADYDHARFLHYLVQQQGNQSGVWLTRIDDMPPLWQWLWQNARYVMLPLSLLLLFWLWRAPLRFGPLLKDIQPQRRSLLEHITASGYYRWHKGQSAYLLTQVQDKLWDNIHRVHPAIRRENMTQSCQQLAAISGIKEALIIDALQTAEESNEPDFSRKIQILERLLKRL